MRKSCFIYWCSHCPVRIRRLSGDNINKKLLGTKGLFITTAGPFKMKIWLVQATIFGNVWKKMQHLFFLVICQKVIMKQALCLSGPEDLWWPWEGLRKQKVEMDSESFFSKRLNQHFVIAHWCKCLICFHITVYFYPPFLTTRCHRAELFPQGFGSSYPTEKYSSASNKELQLHCHFKDLDRPR